MTFIVSVMRQHNRNIFESYVNDPMFDTGAIVQFRSNIGCDAIVIEDGEQTDKMFNTMVLQRDKPTQIKKTLMVLGECPPLGGKSLCMFIHINTSKAAHDCIVFFPSETQKSTLL